MADLDMGTMPVGPRTDLSHPMQAHPWLTQAHVPAGTFSREEMTNNQKWTPKVPRYRLVN